MRWRAELAALTAATLLAGCATTRPVTDGAVKIGKPYSIAGRTYVPRDDRHYDKVGFASWYGPGQGKYTANGERFDMDAISAAHKTLPLPSYAEVTNLKSGRTILVRINDRGPFVDDRIIDLSRGSARALGIEKQGVARVRVRRVYPTESQRAALLRGRTVQLAAAAAAPTPVSAAGSIAVAVAPSPESPVAVAPPAPPPPAVAAVGIPPSSVSTAAPVAASSRYIQVAAFGDGDRADALAARLRAVAAAHVDAGGDLYRVRLGPFDDDATAMSALAEVRRRGYQDAHIVSAMP